MHLPHLDVSILGAGILSYVWGVPLSTQRGANHTGGPQGILGE